jgi:flagellar M-ring protein FliF
MNNSTAGQISTINTPQKPGALDYIAQGLGSPKMGALIALSAGLTLGVGLILWSMKPSFTPVFSQLDRQDVAQVLDALRADNIPYEIQAGTGLVLVPQDQVDMVRMKLGASGIPSNSSVGLELLHKEQSLGTSQFMETTRYQHALETELGRTISSMRNVKSARIHLALPKQSIFVRNRAKASASVMLSISPGRALEQGQVLAMVNLLASSIPYLESSQVTIVDQWGKLLSSGEDGQGVGGKVQKQYEYSRKLESLYAKRIEALLTPLIGPGSVRATVTTSIDFTENEQTQELFEADPTKIRSEQTQDQLSQNGAAVGIPGALTNQPPVAGTTNEDGTETANANPTNKSTNTTRNFELDKTISHTQRAPGTVKQISVAVVLDDRKSIDEEGTLVRTPLTDAELTRFTALVNKVIGFDEARGDSVVVFNQSFYDLPEVAELEPIPLWEQAWVWGASKQVMTGLAVLLLILMVIRPAMRTLKTSNATPQLSAKIDASPALGSEGGESNINSATAMGADGELLNPPKQVYGDILNLARVMADEDPKRVAKVVKDWVGS